MNFFQPWVILPMSHALFSGLTFNSSARLPFRKKIENKCLKMRVMNVPKIVSIINYSSHSAQVHILYYLSDRRFCVKVNEKKRERSLEKLVFL